MPGRPFLGPTLAGVIAITAACVLLIAADAPASAGIPQPRVSVQTPFVRIEVAADAVSTTSVAVTATQEATLLAIETDCRCVSSPATLPLRLAAGIATILPLRIVGVLPGVKTVTLRTTAGTVQIQVQVVTAGLGLGRDILEGVLRVAVEKHLTPVVIVHDLRGEIRNCGCSAGSLGGIEHLAVLPALLRERVPGARLLLSGDANGSRDGVEAALIERGWSRDDRAIVVTADPLSALNLPGVIAVIPTVPAQANHRRLLVPLVGGGMVAEVLLVDAQNQIVDQVRLPIDQTLPADPAILARFPEHLSVRIDGQAAPSATCMACHAGAHGSWAASRHAAALSSLADHDRVDACVRCHTTPIGAGVVTGGVHCQACHLGADAHAQGAGKVRTSGSTDCRSCHDGRHHPGFDPVAAWASIAHGR